MVIHFGKKNNSEKIKGWEKITEGNSLINYENKRHELVQLLKVHVGSKQKWSVSFPSSKNLFIFKKKEEALKNAIEYMEAHPEG